MESVWRNKSEQTPYIGKTSVKLSLSLLTLVALLMAWAAFR